MNQLFKLQNEKSWKTLLLTGDTILLVNKSYDSENEFNEKFHEKGLLKERKEILIAEISKVSYPEKEAFKATISYGDKNQELIFSGVNEQQDFVQTIARAGNFTVSTAEVSTWKAISPFVIGLAITALFTFITYTDAATIEAGDEVDTSGRKSLYKQLFAWLGGQLGSQGTIIAGSLVGLVLLYFIYKRLQSKPTEIVYA